MPASLHEEESPALVQQMMLNVVPELLNWTVPPKAWLAGEMRRAGAGHLVDKGSHDGTMRACG